MYITTRYTWLGYVTELEQAGTRTELARGGNHPMCSESVLRPSEPGEVPLIQPLTLPQIRAHALQAHQEQLAAHPGAIGTIQHDKDSQDEEMAMLDLPHKMRKVPGLMYKLGELRKRKRQHQNLHAQRPSWCPPDPYHEKVSAELDQKEADLLSKLALAISKNLKS